MGVQLGFGAVVTASSVSTLTTPNGVNISLDCVYLYVRQFERNRGRTTKSGISYDFRLPLRSDPIGVKNFLNSDDLGNQTVSYTEAQPEYIRELDVSLRYEDGLVCESCNIDWKAEFSFVARCF